MEEMGARCDTGHIGTCAFLGVVLYIRSWNPKTEEGVTSLIICCKSGELLQVFFSFMVEKLFLYGKSK